MKRVFDCHLHIDNGLTNYNIEINNANIIFNYVEQYISQKDYFPDFYKSLIFDFRNNYDFVFSEIMSERIHAIKIHSRIQHIQTNEYPEILKAIKKIGINIPIIYDAFYFGSDIDFQPSLPGLLYLAKELPNTKFIVAHAGGYKILEYFFHLRELKNIAFDLSLSLQYLSDSSAKFDLIKLIKFTSIEKIFFGSDFPFADPKYQFSILFETLINLGVSSRDIEDVFSTNWLNYILN